MIMEYLGRNVVSRWHGHGAEILKIAQRTKLGEHRLTEFTLVFHLLDTPHFFGNSASLKVKMESPCI